MKRKIYMMSLLSLMAMGVLAQEVVTGVEAQAFNLGRSGDYLEFDLTLDLSGLAVKRNQAVLLTPCLIQGDDSLHLESIGVYGRRRYYHYLRNYGEGMITGGHERSYRAKELPATVSYHEVLPYRVWMDGMEARVHRDLYGCCEQLLASETGPLGGYLEPVPYVPGLLYVQPQAEARKSRSLEGSAYVDFVVDRTDINPGYRNNPTELARIHATIDSVRNDSDITIDGIWLKGYASPESPYSHNRDLARGRVAAVKEYVQRLYRFDEGIITTEYEPEDWAGLRRYVEASDLEHRGEILALIDGSLDPDSKELRIKRSYPAEYRQLLHDCYPALRHTDYRVHYTIRGYSDVDEIREIYRTKPRKLCLNELYLLAQTEDPGSEAFTDIFETAVRMYPDDETANLNAANAAMGRNDFTAAARYLIQAGASGEAEYARGVLAYLTGQYDEVQGHLLRASEAGISQADEFLEHLPAR